MSKFVIHIFNPETDYALACGEPHYNPPASIIKLRKEMALFPATFAGTGDCILLLDQTDNDALRLSPYFHLAERKSLKLIPFHELCRYSSSSDEFEIKPWGWNMSLRNNLIAHGIKSKFIKSEKEIDYIRSLSHRRTCISFQKELSFRCPELGIKTAVEFSDTDDALLFCKNNPGAFLKMPWSSSGRGVICTNGIPEWKLREWIHGAIKHQGSVMAEHGYNRVADFATEWKCLSGEVFFMGLSFFDTTPDGRYAGNKMLCQSKIEKEIAAVTPFWNDKVKSAQQEAIKKLIAPHYDGPLGIDMLADKNGDLNPCVEINLRMTMGMATVLTMEL